MLADLGYAETIGPPPVLPASPAVVGARLLYAAQQELVKAWRSACRRAGYTGTLLHA
jgi:hypothetical protein